MIPKPRIQQREDGAALMYSDGSSRHFVTDGRFIWERLSDGYRRVCEELRSTGVPLVATTPREIATELRRNHRSAHFCHQTGSIRT